MSASLDDEERELRMGQMRTDIELKLAGLALQQQQLRWEPLKIVAASMAAGAALFGAALAFWATFFKLVS